MDVLIAQQRRRRILIAAVAGYIAVHRRNENPRRLWVKQWIQKRPQQGVYLNLLQELRNEDPSSYKNFLRMDQAQFDDIAARITPLIMRENTHFRSAIVPGERLAITLRFLATGKIITKIILNYFMNYFPLQTG
jgi:hypothetical protein